MKKAIALLLALLTFAALLASCGEAASTVSKAETAADSAVTAEAVVTEVTRASADLPADLDFGGREFRQIAPAWQGYKYYFFADEQTGDVMNDAIYERRIKTEELLNVAISCQMGALTIADVANKLKSTVLAGEDTYDQVFLHCIQGVADSASSGYLYNLDDLPYIDITADWWNQEQMDILRLGRNTYYAVNDMMLPCPYVIFFSKLLVENYGMQNPYELVYDGSWTLDVFAEMSEAVTADLNGDGAMTKDDDSFGMSCNEISKFNAFMYGCDQWVNGKDSDTAEVTLVCNTEKMQRIIEVFASLSEQKCYFAPVNGDDLANLLTIDSGRLMFQLDALSSAELMREYEVEFGFLPYPKYDESQDGYRSLDWGGLMGIPVTITDPECVGAVVEYLAWDSENNVLPTYYDVVLTGKLTRGSDDEKMLDILFDTVCYDTACNYFGFANGYNDLFYAIGKLAMKGSSDYASWYAKTESKATATLEKFYAALEETEG